MNSHTLRVTSISKISSFFPLKTNAEPMITNHANCKEKMDEAQRSWKMKKKMFEYKAMCFQRDFLGKTVCITFTVFSFYINQSNDFKEYSKL